MIDIQQANELIPQLLTGSKEFTRSLNNRLKVNSIFNEYDVNVNQKFNQYVNMSNVRYKSVKSGNRLENILRIQKRSYIDLAEKINENDVVKNIDEIEDEKKKLEKINNNKKYKELADIRAKLRMSTQNFTKAEIRKRELLNEKIKDRQSYNTSYNNWKQNKFATTTQSEIKERKKTKNLSEKKDPLEEKQQFVCQLMTEDQDYIKTHINEYQKFLNVMKQSAQEGKNIKIEKNYVEGQPNIFLTDKFNLLSFKEVKKEVQTKKKEEDISVDINKLMRYTKKGKELMKRLHYKVEEPSPIVMQTEPNSSLKLDTVNVLKTEANNCLYLDEKLNQKKENLDMFLKSVYLPNIDEYETNCKSKFVVTGTNSTLNMFKDRNSKIEQMNSTTKKGKRKCLLSQSGKQTAHPLGITAFEKSHTAHRLELEIAVAQHIDRQKRTVDRIAYLCPDVAHGNIVDGTRWHCLCTFLQQRVEPLAIVGRIFKRQGLETAARRCIDCLFNKAEKCVGYRDVTISGDSRSHLQIFNFSHIMIYFCDYKTIVGRRKNHISPTPVRIKSNRKTLTNNVSQRHNIVSA